MIIQRIDSFHNFVDICRCIFDYVSSVNCTVKKKQSYSIGAIETATTKFDRFLLMQSSVKYNFLMKIVTKETVYKLIN